MDPDDDEVNFDFIRPADSERHNDVLMTVDDVKNSEFDNAKVVNTFGRITFTGSTETVTTKGKLLQKQEALLTDNTATVRMVLWEGDIKQVESGSTYILTKAIVRSYRDDNYVTLNKQTSLQKVDRQVERQDDPPNIEELFEISTPATGVHLVQRFLLCNRCSANIIDSDEQLPTIDCSECTLTQLKTACKQDLYASAFFIKANNERVTILLKKNIIRSIFFINHNQENAEQQFDSLTNQDVIQLLLTTNTILRYNDRNVAVDVHN